MTDPAPDDLDLVPAIGAALTSYIVGVDWGEEDSKTTFWCSCGCTFDTVDELATHAIRAHRVFSDACDHTVVVSNAPKPGYRCYYCGEHTTPPIERRSR